MKSERTGRSWQESQSSCGSSLSIPGLRWSIEIPIKQGQQSSVFVETGDDQHGFKFVPQFWPRTTDGSLTSVTIKVHGIENLSKSSFGVQSTSGSGKVGDQADNTVGLEGSECLSPISTGTSTKTERIPMQRSPSPILMPWLFQILRLEEKD